MLFPKYANDIITHIYYATALPVKKKQGFLKFLTFSHFRDIEAPVLIDILSKYTILFSRPL